MGVYGVNPNRVTVVYPACDAAFRPLPEQAVLDARARYGLAGDFVLHVGTLQPRKNVQRLLTAFSEALQLERVERAKTPSLVFVGKLGWNAEEIRGQIADLESQGLVKWLGYVERGDLPGLMNAARTVVMPSLYEGFGLPVVEAMACGTPVVCSNTSSLPEVAGDAALLVDPLDVRGITAALSRILWDDQLWLDLREKGLAQAAKFTWETAAQQALEVLTRDG
jgi:glycosyltransferase involved in cell wall biosynthesis